MAIGDIFNLKPDLPFTSTQAKYNWIRSMLPGAFERGWSGAKTLQAFQRAGIGIRKTEFYALRRDVLGLEEQAQRVKYISRKAQVSAQLFAPLRQYIPEKYFYAGYYEILDPEGEVIGVQGFGYASDVIGRRGEIEADLKQKIQSDSPPLEGAVGMMYLQRAYISPDRG